VIFTAEDKLRCVEREIKMRKQVYPNRVLTGRMTQVQADREIACMEAIAQDLSRVAEKDRLI